MSEFDERGGIVAMKNFFHLYFVIGAHGEEGSSRIYWIGSERV
jgi:hypothetical protein